MEHIFSTRSNQFHLAQLTPIQKFYSIQGVLAYENLVDRAMLLLCEQLENRFVNGANAAKAFDIADWISYCELHLSACFILVCRIVQAREAMLTAMPLISLLGSPGRDHVE